MVKKYITKDSGKRQNYKSGMRRDLQDGKVRYDLIYQPILKRFAELLTRGAVKYGTWNWSKANSREEYDRFRSSAFRHFMQYMNGEDDEDHGMAVYFNIMCMEYLKERLPEIKKPYREVKNENK